ncbi:mitochondrial 54S ribosomal protein uL6m [Ascoidea rubescens DSM 1968]|uniref:60S ribosomal protein L6, mitochondrial n=1 Tax=Ascoidea rubescens DSM 1968 TaxID=1344418 RepID=A0A1D2VCJ1_9ASCO|nr:60S ribosomal protein L6, mitochondrial precursor [Ascoidea rubescens DSM 1968]ODV59203.1 60S ribosomal protein L6, mitochondrial precursor [Ascoidea rubescens DSM 1968]
MFFAAFPVNICSGRNIALGFSKRLFSQTGFARSHVGSQPIILPPEVQFEIQNLKHPKRVVKGRDRVYFSREVFVTGPKGTQRLVIPDHIQTKLENEKLTVLVEDPTKKIQKSMWGTIRSRINNDVIGVTEGHLCILRLVGTGYRAHIEDRPDGSKFVGLKVGFCVLKGLPVPAGLQVSSPVPTTVIIEGIDKQQVKLFAGNLRRIRPPEPYKGKGIYIDDETIKLKDKKIK